MTQLCWGCEIIRPSHDDGVVQVKLQCAAGSTRALLRVSGTWRQFTDLLCETRCYEACVRFFSFPMDAKRSEFLLEPSQVL